MKERSLDRGVLIQPRPDDEISRPWSGGVAAVLSPCGLRGDGGYPNRCGGKACRGELVPASGFSRLTEPVSPRYVGNCRAILLGGSSAVRFDPGEDEGSEAVRP